jgi:hypothetical protein
MIQRKFSISQANRAAITAYAKLHGKFIYELSGEIVNWFMKNKESFEILSYRNTDVPWLLKVDARTASDLKRLSKHYGSNDALVLHTAFIQFAKHVAGSNRVAPSRFSSMHAGRQ